MIVPSPQRVHEIGEQIANGAAVKPEVVSALLQDVANAWQADLQKIAYLESLLLRK